MRFWAPVATLFARVLRRPDALGRAIKGPRLYAYMDAHTAMTTLHDGHLIFVDPTDEQLTPSLVAYGMWETWIERVVRKYLLPGHRVIEVGANVGYYTLVMGSLVGPTGRVEAFEANPRMARLLRRSIGSSGRGDYVKLHEQIVSDQPGTLHLYTSSRFGGAGNVVENGWPLGDDTEVFEREAVQLDVMFAGETFDFIRIDTEGSEVLILKGAMEILARSPTIKLCIEWQVGMMQARGDLAGLVSALCDLKFQFWRVDVAKLTPLTPEAALVEPVCEMFIARSLD